MARECVVHLTQSFGCGGLERVIANVIQANTSPDIEHVVVSLLDDLSFSYALPAGVKCLTVNKKDGLDLYTHIRFGKLLRTLRATVLHTYNFATLEYHAVARLCGVKKHVHADHGLGGDHPEGQNAFHNKFRRWISLFIHDYIVVSNDLKQWVTGTVGIPEKKVRVIFNGVPVPPPQPLPVKVSGVLKLVIVGRLAPVKNHARLFSALSQVSRERPDLNVTCCIVGDGELRALLEQQRDALPKPERVTFVGAQQDVAPFLLRADCLVLCSDYEAMPMTVLEAMAACRPVICPLVGGVGDFLGEQDVFLTEGKSVPALKQAIISLAEQHSDTYAQKVEAAYHKAHATFNLETMAQHYQKIYTQK